MYLNTLLVGQEDQQDANDKDDINDRVAVSERDIQLQIKDKGSEDSRLDGMHRAALDNALNMKIPSGLQLLILSEAVRMQIALCQVNKNLDELAKFYDWLGKKCLKLSIDRKMIPEELFQ